MCQRIFFCNLSNLKMICLIFIKNLCTSAKIIIRSYDTMIKLWWALLPYHSVVGTRWHVWQQITLYPQNEEQSEERSLPFWGSSPRLSGDVGSSSCVLIGGSTRILMARASTLASQHYRRIFSPTQTCNIQVCLWMLSSWIDRATNTGCSPFLPIFLLLFFPTFLYGFL